MANIGEFKSGTKTLLLACDDGTENLDELKCQVGKLFVVHSISTNKFEGRTNVILVPPDQLVPSAPTELELHGSEQQSASGETPIAEVFLKWKDCGNESTSRSIVAESDYAATVKALSDAIQVLATEQKTTYNSCVLLSDVLADVVNQRMAIEGAAK